MQALPWAIYNFYQLLHGFMAPAHRVMLPSGHSLGLECNCGTKMSSDKAGIPPGNIADQEECILKGSRGANTAVRTHFGGQPQSQKHLGIYLQAECDHVWNGLTNDRHLSRGVYRQCVAPMLMS